MQTLSWHRSTIPLGAVPLSSGRAAYMSSLAYDRAELREARQGPRKQGVRVTGSRRCVCPRFRGVLARKIVSDDRNAPGVEVGRPKDTYRRVRIDSTFGKIAVLVTDGQLPYPYGREISGYEVANLADTVSKAKAAGATVLVDPYTADRRQAAIISFPGGYIAEILTCRANSVIPAAHRREIPECRTSPCSPAPSAAIISRFIVRCFPDARGWMLERHRSSIRMTGPWWAVQCIAAITVLLPWPVQAQNSNSGTNAPTRPSIMFTRREEDWSVLLIHACRGNLLTA